LALVVDVKRLTNFAVLRELAVVLGECEEVNLTIRNTPREQRDAKGIGLQTR
jgi:hypothetical protein